MTMPQQPDLAPADDVGEVVGRVVSLASYPLKSARGLSLAEVQVGPGGLAGDRRWALTVDGEVVGAKQVAALSDLEVEVEGGYLFVRAGDRATPADGARLAEALGLAGSDVGVADLGSQEQTTGHVQLAAVHLVSEGAPGQPGCEADPRANLVLQLPVPGAEREWVGRRLVVGECELQLTRVPKKCLGVYAEVVRPGVLRLGDQVLLLGG